MTGIRKAITCIALLAVTPACAQLCTSSIRYPVLSTISAKGSIGRVIQPYKIKNRHFDMPMVQGLALEVGFRPSRPKLVDSLFGMPTFGLGLYKPYLHQKELLGDPYSIYATYGSTVFGVGHKCSLGWQAQLGLSRGWLPYHFEFNPTNHAIGAKNNYHASAALFLNLTLQKRVSTKIGVSLTHFSDGSYRLPNSGINIVSAFADVTYATKANTVKPFTLPKGSWQTPSHVEFDTEAKMSYRQVRARTSNTGEIARVHYGFKSYSIASYMLASSSLRFRFGIGYQLMYDESYNLNVRQAYDTTRGVYFYPFQQASIKRRFGSAMLIRSELSCGYVNLCADVGYLFNNGAYLSNALAINLALKSYVYRSSYLTFGVQTVPSRKSNCTFLGVGYSFNKPRIPR